MTVIPYRASHGFSLRSGNHHVRLVLSGSSTDLANETLILHAEE